MLRPYQQEAHDKIVAWIRKTTEPCMIEAATGAGKSHIIAELARTVRKLSNKHVLCIAPSKELVEQNHAKYPEEASFFSASVGIKCREHPVVFGTPLTVLNSIDKSGEEIGMIIIDECHGITPTIRKIIGKIPNPNMRVVGMSATPYRLGSGYVFKQWEDGRKAGENAFFTRCVYRIRAHELIDQGYLTRPVVGSLNADAYSTKNMKLNSMGQFDAADIDRAYHGQGRKTARIIADIVAQSQDRKGVLIFAATVRHANECLESLPPELSAIVTGETPKRERERILAAFKRQEIKYIVNVSVLTTGFDATHARTMQKIWNAFVQHAKRGMYFVCGLILMGTGLAGTAIFSILTATKSKVSSAIFRLISAAAAQRFICWATNCASALAVGLSNSVKNAKLKMISLRDTAMRATTSLWTRMKS